MKKKILCGVCAAVLALSLAGCATEEDPVRVHVSDNWPANRGNTTRVETWQQSYFTVEETDDAFVVTITMPK